jgi:hypothetical protein
MRAAGPDREYCPLHGFYISADEVYGGLIIRFGAVERSDPQPHVTDARRVTNDETFSQSPMLAEPF